MGGRYPKIATLYVSFKGQIAVFEGNIKRKLPCMSIPQFPLISKQNEEGLLKYLHPDQHNNNLDNH